MTLDARHDFLRRLSPAAGQLAMDYFRRRGELAVEEKGQTDYVSIADRAVESMIAGEIAKAFPGDAFLGEETANTLDGVPERLWIVDPIDGTHNFLRGVPYWNVVDRATWSAACARWASSPIPAPARCTTRRRGTGAWCSDAKATTRLAASRRTELPGATSCVGHHDRSPDPRYFDSAGADGPQRRDAQLRLRGAAARARRRRPPTTPIVELELSSWDAMAGLLLVEEAGGYATVPPPTPPSARDRLREGPGAQLAAVWRGACAGRRRR